MKKNNMTIEELKKTLIDYREEEGYFDLDSIEQIAGSYVDIDVYHNEQATGMVIVYIKNGMAVIPYSEVGYHEFHLNAIQMMNEEMLGIMERVLNYQKQQVKNMEFILEKQRLRKLF